MKARLQLIAALAVAIAPLKASAQAWVTNPDLSEGEGIRAGNFELHPSLGAEAGYDSNYFRASDQEFQGNGKSAVVDVYKLRFTPSLTLSTLGRERLGGAKPNVAFGAAAFLSYYQLFAADKDNADVAKRSNLGAGADFKLHVFPQGKVGFDLSGAYIRLIEGEGRVDRFNAEGFNRDTLRGAAGVTWRPGGGLFEWRAGYGVTYNWFENDAYTSLRNIHHQFGTGGRWRFLPRSALLFDSSYTLVRYLDNPTQQTDGDLVRTRIGFHGLVTYHLSLLGMVGWGSSFYEGHPGSIQPRQFDSIIANAEARWYLQARPDLDATTITSGLSSIALGWNRTFNSSYYGSFYQRDRGYLQATMFIVGAVAGGAELGLSRIAFPDVVTSTGTNNPAFSQLRIDAKLFAEYRFIDHFAVNATIAYDQVNSPMVSDEHLDYSRWQAYVGARLFW